MSEGAAALNIMECRMALAAKGLAICLNMKNI